jgi:hypothetical protein
MTALHLAASGCDAVKLLRQGQGPGGLGRWADSLKNHRKNMGKPCNFSDIIIVI